MIKVIFFFFSIFCFIVIYSFFYYFCCFARLKDGSRKKDPTNLYANPHNPFSVLSTREEIHDPVPVASVSQQQYFIWNGGFHTRPEYFSFPSLTVEQAWYAWCVR